MWFNPRGVYVFRIRIMTKHNMRHTTEYTIWTCINTRCYNKNCKAYKNYGGRGIKCEWKSLI